jgi:hypothetical protein
MKTFLKRVLGLGALAAIGYAIWRAYDRRRLDTGTAWEPQAFPYPPQPRPIADEPSPVAKDHSPVADAPDSGAGDARATTSWVEPDGGTCPASHPVKAKLSSGIFHVPGGTNYNRTLADRCYASAEAAESDGLRPAKN